MKGLEIRYPEWNVGDPFVHNHPLQKSRRRPLRGTIFSLDRARGIITARRDGCEVVRCLLSLDNCRKP